MKSNQGYYDIFLNSFPKNYKITFEKKISIDVERSFPKEKRLPYNASRIILDRHVFRFKQCIFRPELNIGRRNTCRFDLYARKRRKLGEDFTGTFRKRRCGKRKRNTRLL